VRDYTFSYLFDELACYYSFAHLSTNQHAITFFALFMVQVNIRTQD